MTKFSLSAPSKTIFGRDSRAEAAERVPSLGDRVLLVRGRSVPWVDELISGLRAIGTEVHEVPSRGEPDLNDVRQATEQARSFVANCVVAVGGGAVIDLGKAVAALVPSAGDPAEYLELGGNPVLRLDDPLPFVAIPTTAGTGAEATKNAVITVPEKEVKISLRDPRMIPDLVVIDPALTDGTPRGLTLASGLDAVTQLIESYLTIRANPVTDAICRGTIPQAIAALRQLMAQEDIQARDTMARASYLSGLALANSGLGIVHGLAAVIGGKGGAHGAICGRLLAPSLEVNRDVAARGGTTQTRFEEVDTWLRDGLNRDADSGIAALRSFVDAHDLPTLEDLNCSKTEFGAVAKAALAASSTQANPVRLAGKNVLSILRNADCTTVP